MTRMPVRTLKVNICVPALLFLAFGVRFILAFSDGRKLASGITATRSIYCHRSGGKRQPFHFDKECGGYCEPHRNSELFYTIDVPTSTYWLDAVFINISAKADSGKSVTGFSIHALNEKGDVAGSFVEDEERGVVTGTCSDIITYSQETSGAFHRMANHSRKNITLEWQPDGYNHGPIKFVAWVVNNHSDIFYLESHPLNCARNGSSSLDLQSVLHKVLNDIDLDRFEKSFNYRSKMGYQLDLEDPFAPFENPPKVIEFVPLTTSHFRVQPKKIPIHLRGSTKSSAEQERQFEDMISGGFDNLLGGVSTVLGGSTDQSIVIGSGDGAASSSIESVVGGDRLNDQNINNVIRKTPDVISSTQDGFVGGALVNDKENSKTIDDGVGEMTINQTDSFVGGAMLNDRDSSKDISSGGEATTNPTNSSMGGATVNEKANSNVVSSTDGAISNSVDDFVGGGSVNDKDQSKLISNKNDATSSKQNGFMGGANAINENNNNPINEGDNTTSVMSDELVGDANVDNQNNIIQLTNDSQGNISDSSNDTFTTSTVNAAKETTQRPILLAKLVP